VNNLEKRQPLGVSKIYIYYALSILGFRFEAFKTARFGYEQMQLLKIPDSWQEEIDMANLKCRSKPFSDKEGYIQVCNRCMTQNALINLNGDKCGGCGKAFLRNMHDFDSLPLVEFIPGPNITSKRVTDLLRQDPPDDAIPTKPQTI
jgi:hypothetical protein